MSIFSDSALFSKMLPAAAGGSHLKAGAPPPAPPLELVPELEDEEDVPVDDDDIAIDVPVLPPVPFPPAPPPDDEGVVSLHARPAAVKARSVVHADEFTH